MKCICFLLLHNKLPQTARLKPIYYLIVSVGLLLRTEIKVLASLHFHLEALGKNLLPIVFRDWQNSAPSGCMIEVPIFLLAEGLDSSWLLEAALSSLPYGSLHWKSTTWQLTSSRSTGESLFLSAKMTFYIT